METQQIASEKTSTLFQPEETENLHGEVEKDLERFKGNPRLFQLLSKFKDIFGPLPPPSAGCTLVQMDVQLREEWVGKPLRQKCWPMPLPDQQKIEQQAGEFLRVGLIEVSPRGNTPVLLSNVFGG